MIERFMLTSLMDTLLFLKLSASTKQAFDVEFPKLVMPKMVIK